MTASKRLTQAARRFARFHERTPDGARRIKMRIPDVVLRVGDISGIMYVTDDGQAFIHRFKVSSRPQLAASSDGKTLVMLGGAYQFTERGIVDR